MKKTWTEQAIAKLKKFGKKNKVCKFFAKLAIYIVVAVHALVFYAMGNAKRFGGVAVVWLLFVVSCSFALPGNVESTFAMAGANEFGENPASDRENEIQAILAGEEAVLDDNDVIDGYEDAQISNANVDVYSIEDILDEDTAAVQTKSKEELDVSSIVLNKDDWKLILINKHHPVPDGYEFELGTIKGNMKCDARILDSLLQMMQAAKEDGIDLMVCSPYRDLNRQKVLFERKIKAYMNKGLSYLEAYQVSSQAVTVPGASEHQIGLALDIVCNTYQSLNDGFGETEAGKWLYDNAYQFGFIQRYPQGKEYITGIMYEPWHYRYVGVEAATIIKQNDITLEELVEGL